MKVTSTCNVLLEFRVMTFKHGDSFYVQFDGGKKHVWHVGSHGTPTWQVCYHVFRLRPGNHKLHVYNREAGAKFNEVRIKAGHAMFVSKAPTVAKISLQYIPVVKLDSNSNSNVRQEHKRYTG